MKLHHSFSSSVFVLALGLLCGCRGSMSVQEIDPRDDDDSQASDDDDTAPGDDDDITPSDDDDTTPGDDDTAPGDDDDTGTEPIADCGPFSVPPEDFPEASVHYSGKVDADRPNPGEARIWAGCEVRRYFDAGHHYQCQVYWSVIGERREWSDPCSVYETEATYIPEYSDCSPAELGNDAYFLEDFDWHFATEYHWSSGLLSLWSAPGNTDPEVPGGPPGGQCGFNGPQGNNWSPWDQNIPFKNWGGEDEWDHLQFEYSTNFQPTD